MPRLSCRHELTGDGGSSCTSGTRLATDEVGAFRLDIEPLRRLLFGAKRIQIVTPTNGDRVPHFLGDTADVGNDSLPMRAIAVSKTIVIKPHPRCTPDGWVDVKET